MSVHLALAILGMALAPAARAQEPRGQVADADPPPWLALPTLPPPTAPLRVPFVAQERLLCGAAAVEMALRHAGAVGVYARDFRGLVREEEGGIRTDELAAAVAALGWSVRAGPTDALGLRADLAAGRPATVLLVERPGRYHYVLVVGWEDGMVRVHDPGRRPDIELAQDDFLTRWAGAGNWSLVVIGAAAVGAGPSAASSAAPTAAEISTSPPVAAHPDLTRASEHFRAGRFGEAAASAEAAARAAPHDPRVWALLGTSRFLAGDGDGALAAWSRERLPAVDRVSLSGLRRTRHPVVQTFLGFTPGTPLTPAALARARRRLALLPALDGAATSLDYRVLPGRLALVEAVAFEARTFPSPGAPLVVAALRTLVTREAEVRVAAPTGGGEALRGRLRWERARPAAEVSLAAPAAPLPGVVGVRLGWERERHATWEGAPSRVESRTQARAWLTDWATGWLRWEVAAGAERWSVRSADLADIDVPEAVGVLASEMEVSPPGRGVSLIASVERALGAEGSGWLRWRLRADAVPLSPASPWRLNLLALAAGVGADAPRLLWPGADARGVREGLLRAHTGERQGQLMAVNTGTSLLNASVELERRILRTPLGALGVATFLDGARITPWAGADAASRPRVGRLLLDAGMGLRLEVPGGRFRLDVARGSDGASALSMGWSHPLR